jgi:hypothetical protein
MKKIAIFFGGVGVLVLAYLAFKKPKAITTTKPVSQGGGNTQTDTNTNQPPRAGFPANLDYNKTLQSGMSGAEVRELQLMLQVYADRSVPETGVMDYKTRDALYYNSTPRSRTTTLKHFIETHTDLRWTQSGYEKN